MAAAEWLEDEFYPRVIKVRPFSKRSRVIRWQGDRKWLRKGDYCGTLERDSVVDRFVVRLVVGNLAWIRRDSYPRASGDSIYIIGSTN